MQHQKRRGGEQLTPGLDPDVHFRLARVRDRVAAELDVGTVFMVRMSANGPLFSGLSA